eukprot:gene4914-3526_t
MSYIRRATHSGPRGSGWYESVPELLRKNVEAWMAPGDRVPGPEAPVLQKRLLGIISPHAGLRFGGPTAGKAYAVLKQYLGTDMGSRVRSIVIMGPSHHKGFPGMEMSDASAYDTPLGALPVNREVVKNIIQQCRAKHIPVKPTFQDTDETEHSLELQLPFIAALDASRQFSLVPIIVGIMNREMEEDVSAVLKPYLEDPQYLFIFSSDFCHWGQRFGYTYMYEPKKHASIADSIEAMDRKGVELLAAKNMNEWYDYLDKTKNTICGRHPISVGLQYWAKLSSSSVQLQGYSQSNRVTNPSDGSSFGLDHEDIDLYSPCSCRVFISLNSGLFPQYAISLCIKLEYGAMKNRRRHTTTLKNVIQPVPFDHDLFRHTYVAGEGVDVIDLANGDSIARSKKAVDALLSAHFRSEEYLREHATNQAFLHMRSGSSASTVLQEIESKDPHLWFVSQEEGRLPYGHVFATPTDLFAFFKDRGMKVPGRRQRGQAGSDIPPITRWIDIQTRGDVGVVQEILARFPMDAETEDQCLYLLGQDRINTARTALGSDRAYMLINLMCTPVVTSQTMNLCHSAQAGPATLDTVSSQHVSSDALCRGKSVMEMRFNAMRNNISRRAVPDPVPVAVLAYPGWVITIHDAPFAEMDDLLRMLQVYCSHGEEGFHTTSLNLMTHQRFTTALFVVSFLRIAVGHDIDSVALAEVVNELGDVVFDVPASLKEQERIIRRITDTRRCFGECGTDVNRREQIVDTLLDPELENNFITQDPVIRRVLETLQSHLRYTQHELADYRDTVAVSHWYHNVAVQRCILIRGNGDLRMNLLLTEMCNIMYPVMLVQTLYSMNVIVPFDSNTGDPPSTSLAPFCVTAVCFVIYILWFGRAMFKVFRQKVFHSQFLSGAVIEMNVSVWFMPPKLRNDLELMLDGMSNCMSRAGAVRDTGDGAVGLSPGLMVLQRTPRALRSAVAFFNMKHFQVQQKIRVTPSTVHEVFSTYLRPDDRLLRQSRAGAGSTRVLVLNKSQKVKAVYLPVLCVPHPSIVGSENAVLGLPVKEYLEFFKTAQEQEQTTFAALSYPKGIAFSVYDSAGNSKMPLVNVPYSHISTDANVARGIGKHAYMSAGNANRSRAVEFVTAVHSHRDVVADCAAFFMINRERGSCLLLSDLQRLERASDPDEEMVTGMEDKQEPLDPDMFTIFRDDSRWMSLPEQALQSHPDQPLYTDSVPNEDGLQRAMSSGVLLLDFRPRQQTEENKFFEIIYITRPSFPMPIQEALGVATETIVVCVHHTQKKKRNFWKKKLDLITKQFIRSLSQVHAIFASVGDFISFAPCCCSCCFCCCLFHILLISLSAFLFLLFNISQVSLARILCSCIIDLISCKGVVENRITKHYSNRTVEECKAEREAELSKAKHPNPRNRKEELSHLTQHCSYEYVPEFQRWANDMMAVYSDPQGYGHDMAYHYHRIWKAKSLTRRGIEDGSGAFDVCKIHPQY